MLKLEKVAIFSLATPFAIAMTFLGLIAGVAYALIGAIYDLFNNQLGIGTFLAFFAIVGMPIIFAIFGFIIGFIGALLNNLVVNLFGK